MQDPHKTASELASGRGRRIGEPFNPWHKLCGFYPPDVLACQRGITDGQKRLYERAVRWAGRNGSFWYSFETIANALGKSVRQVKNDMTVLEARGLIGHTRRRRQSNQYFFLWHPIFEMQPAAHQDSIVEVQDSILEVQDKVILKVQSTAQEFSPLESCPLNLEKADEKLIPGDASQNRRSASSLRVSLAQETPNTKGLSADAEKPLTSDAVSETTGSAQGWTERELAEVRQRITALWGSEPEPGFEVSVMLRARGGTAAAVCDLFDRKAANPKCRSGGRWAPRSLNWFLTVIENEFAPGHLPEPPADRQLPSEDMCRGIEVLELPDAERSIVESVPCAACGGCALVRYTDGTIEGCQCHRARGVSFTRVAPAGETRSEGQPPDAREITHLRQRSASR
jgi:hypothetical protein